MGNGYWVSYIRNMISLLMKKKIQSKTIYSFMIIKYDLKEYHKNMIIFIK
jgi:hypothetical protein